MAEQAAASSERARELANAAIWYAPDGYDTGKNGINGRRVAGESFLRGYLAHAVADGFTCLTHGTGDEQHFRDFAARNGVTRPLRGVRLEQAGRIAPLDVVSYPSPNYATECWRRALWGPASYAICGITHTTATLAVMQGLFDLRAAPQQPWDAVICTSQSVQASVLAQMELTDAHLAERFGGRLPARPLLPVLPLGVHGADFAPDPAAGEGLRARLGLAKGDIACAIIARLTPHEKFDPLPLYLALAQAQLQVQAQAGAGRRFHLILCGQLRDDYGRNVFVRGARALMPDVGFHLLDGADAVARRATLSAADLFLFPIDNVQETFGLAPIEAMAAGLPVIVSDWDGMRDTVTGDVGIRVPTMAPTPDLSAYLGLRHHGGTDSYVQYLGQLSAMTQVDVRAMAAALVALGSDPGLRARMGAAGKARVARLYDWRVVIPQYQALWAEQAAMVARARQGSLPRGMDARRVPPAPAPGVFFGRYPTASGPDPARRFRAHLPQGRVDVQAMLALRDYAGLRRVFEGLPDVAAVMAAVQAGGDGGADSGALAAATGLGQRVVLRILLWLLKYDFARQIDDKREDTP